MADEVIRQLRDFPAVEELLQDEELSEAVASIPRPVASELIKSVIARNKAAFKQKAGEVTLASLRSDIRQTAADVKLTEISRVINATGIVVHTNLGRAPLPESLFEEVKRTVVGYGNIEFDLATGKRGHRGVACEKYLATVAGAESATVVNNCAAALFVILNTLASRKKVVVSRGELVQIGGGFRIPDILKRSGARLLEVGTTNITTIDDYRSAVDSQVALILKVHKSNFIQAGFSEEVPLKELVALGRKHGLPVINDLGSGVFINTRDILGYAEPSVQQSVRAGADLTCFSGDKMLGGVQAGLIVGRAELVRKIKKNPIFRTIRVDKVVFAVLERLLSVYLDGSYVTDIKLWSLLSTPEAELYRRGKAILTALGNPSGLSLEATRAYVGGGALPESGIPSVGVVFPKPYKANRLLAEFRRMPTPIVGRIEEDRFILDLKAIDEDDLPYLIDSIKTVIE
jgi:L-seryl-tRNA(Ser) seleniumtransferase